MATVRRRYSSSVDGEHTNGRTDACRSANTRNEKSPHAKERERERDHQLPRTQATKTKINTWYCCCTARNTNRIDHLKSNNQKHKSTRTTPRTTTHTHRTCINDDLMFSCGNVDKLGGILANKKKQKNTQWIRNRQGNGDSWLAPTSTAQPTSRGTGAKRVDSVHGGHT
jgi:hypothetical protein